MISVLAIGITKTNNTALKNLDCAIEDAKNIYLTFENIFREDFSQYNSICLENIGSIEFISLLNNYRISSKEEDIFILYFSGHGITDAEKLYLYFSDSDIFDNGKVSSIQLNELLCKFNSTIILLLDCCYSGAGLSIANNKSFYNQQKISVVTSTTPFNTTVCIDKKGSEFANNFCEAIISLNENNEEISLFNICEEVKKADNNILINTEEGQHNIILKNKSTSPFNDINLINRFLEQIKNAGVSTREMLLYSLMDLPSVVKMNFIKKYLDSLQEKNQSEANWLVRRALGSVISEIKGNEEEKLKIILSLIKSPNWMDQCIGLIAARKITNNTELINEQEKIMIDKNKPMDVVWLANLYLSDNKKDNLGKSILSNLSKTEWGILDIWRRYSGEHGEIDTYRTIESIIEDKKLLRSLLTELKIRKIIEPKDEYYEEIAQSSLVDVLYQHENRGPINNQQKKWLYSMVYGNWRDQVSINLKAYLNNTLEDKIKEELTYAKHLPRVEMKMGLFDYMKLNQEDFIKYRKELLWGLKDPHPWVRRVAISTYAKVSEDIEIAFKDSINRIYYPGVFDLIIEAESIGYDTKEYLNMYSFTQSELESINSSISNCKYI